MQQHIEMFIEIGKDTEDCTNKRNKIIIPLKPEKVQYIHDKSCRNDIDLAAPWTALSDI